MSWGYHLILDCAGCKENFESPEKMKIFVDILLKDIQMTPWGECQVEHFAEKPEIAGWTVIQPLTTSTLTMHFLDESGDLYFDLFSCKEFNRGTVIARVKQWFSPLTIKETYLERQA